MLFLSVKFLFLASSWKHQKSFSTSTFLSACNIYVGWKTETCLKKVTVFLQNFQQSLLFIQLPLALELLHLAELKMRKSLMALIYLFHSANCCLKSEANERNNDSICIFTLYSTNISWLICFAVFVSSMHKINISLYLLHLVTSWIPTSTPW